MKSCKEVKPLLEKYISGEITEKEKYILDEHTAHCADCREIVILHNRFIEGELPLPESDIKFFKKMRRKVIHEIGYKNESVVKKFSSLIERFFTKPAIAVSFALLMFVSGIFIPRLWQNEQQVILGQIKQVAYTNKSFEDVENSPYIFQNVKFKALDGNHIALSFDLLTHIDIVRSKDDPIVKEALAQSLLTSKGVGGRLKAISFSDQVISPKIKEGLIYTMLNDENIAVRLKTIESLRPYKKDKDVQKALLQVLKNEKSVPMRLLAVELLTDVKNSSESVMKELGGKNEIIHIQ